MTFKLSTKKIITWPVTIKAPVDGGQTQEFTCSAEFEIIDQDEYNALINDDIAFLCRVVVGFGNDIAEEDGTPIPYNQKNKLRLFKAGGYIRLGFIDAYHRASAGIAEKNLKGSPVTGRSARKSRKKK
ncbi:hypothetical protein [Glaciecola sp. 1036]|uniref:hypothetical protein n=1 Tax=Alteromonadaceae TaxID=72275 RepID=UPI003D06C161